MDASPATWRVGDKITFTGSATDLEEVKLPAPSLSWDLILHHCSTQGSCHEHPVQEFTGVSGGSFVAPDHEYPSYLELRLTATDSGGPSDTKSMRLDPRTVELTFRTSPAGLELIFGSEGEAAPFSRTAIVGSKEVSSATMPQQVDKPIYRFVSWSDGEAQSHEIIAGGTASTYTATYTIAPRISKVMPRPDSSTKDRTPTIRATVGDAETDLTKSDISLYLDGDWIARTTFDYDRTTDTLTYTPGSRLARGWHTVTIKAVYAKGIAGIKTWRFKILRR
jgi:hypothetical protein